MKVYVDECEQYEVSVDDLQRFLGVIQEKLARKERVVHATRMDGVYYESLEEAVNKATNPGHLELTSLSIEELILRTRQEGYEYARRLIMGCEQTCQHWEAYDVQPAGALWAQVLRGIDWLLMAGDRIARLEGRLTSWDHAAGRLSDALRHVLTAMESGEPAACASASRSLVLPTLFALGKWFELGVSEGA